MKELLRKIAAQETLSEAEAGHAMHVMMTGEASSEQIAAFLLGLRSRGETLDELTGLTRVMRQFAVPVELHDENAIDLCGTGGDGSGTFNVSTTAAFVCAGANVTVAKHGNRSVSSECGSSDVLEALGVKTTLRKNGVQYCLREAGIAFIYAPYFHPALAHVMPVRKKLGVRTFFNILGPMCNPAGVTRQMVGAFSKPVAEAMAQILVRLDATQVVAVHSDDGMDELSVSAPSTMYRYDADAAADIAKKADIGSGVNADSDARAGTATGTGTTTGTDASTAVAEVREIRVDPTSLGFRLTPASRILGGTARVNAEILRNVLEGRIGPHRDIATLNAAFALATSGRFESLDACIAAANESIDSGEALRSLGRLVDASNAAPSE